ncbi:Hypothetical protein R9X50_00027200 [Acrodontium crateriforme]|uniref:AB hydrolase-1 domain-containing protein n=1 Tax=Acrodontium crateriforme TaxID=150365 RepID=A0AAQ3R6P1_9PEZI|nr:Hypothetical protein R9X50_00027200 [Acrodontium crateriforme]
MAFADIECESQDGVHFLLSGPAASTSALVFVHGWACEGSDYRYLTHELRERDFNSRIVAVDLPGHGKTPKECCSHPTMSAFAEKISALVNELALERTIVVGHSMGCRIAVETCSKINESSGNAICSGVVFLDGSHYSLRPGRLAFERGDPLHDNRSPEQIDALKEKVFKNMFGDRTPSEFKRTALEHVKAMDSEYSSAIRDAFIEYDYHSWDEALASLGSSGTPLLNFQSNDVDASNQRIQLQAGQVSKWMVHLGQKAPQVKHFVVEDSGHFPHVDQPKKVSEVLLDFMKAIDKIMNIAG